MNLSHIEHIGIAVKSLESAIPFYEEMLGLKCYAVEEVADQRVKTAFFKIGPILSTADKTRASDMELAMDKYLLSISITRNYSG